MQAVSYEPGGGGDPGSVPPEVKTNPHYLRLPKPAPLPREALSLMAPHASAVLEKTTADPVPSEPPVVAKALAEFDRFELLGRVSASAHADVFLARDKLSRNRNSLIALKLLKTSRSSDVRAELPPLHVNLCDVYEQGQSQGKDFVAMEWIEGASLASALHKASEKKGLLDPVVLAAIFAQVARGLERMRQSPKSASARIDLSHVMLRHDGVVKLLRSAAREGSSFERGNLVEDLHASLCSLLSKSDTVEKAEVIDSMAPHVPFAKAPLDPELDEALQRAQKRAMSHEWSAAQAFAEELEAYVDAHRGGDLTDVVMGFMQAVYPDPRAAAPALHTGISLRSEPAPKPRARVETTTPAQESARKPPKIWLAALALAVITASSMWVLLSRNDTTSKANRPSVGELGR